MYFLIHGNEDGETYIETLDRQEIEDRLIGDEIEDIDSRFIDKITEKNTMYWKPYSYLLIKGQIVTPKIRKVVTEYHIP